MSLVVSKGMDVYCFPYFVVWWEAVKVRLNSSLFFPLDAFHNISMEHDFVNHETLVNHDGILCSVTVGLPHLQH